MSNQTFVFITGVGRGIGRALAETYLLRPNHTIIGSVRDRHAAKNQSLKALPAGENSRLLLVSIESASHTDAAAAVQAMQAAGVERLDVVIANAGICPPPALPAALDIQDVIDGFNVNTVGTILLFQAVRPLLERAAAPKWLYVSTGAASIAWCEKHNAAWIAAYGVGKAGTNFFVTAVHIAHPSIISFAIHPGLVQTDMGNAGARMAGMEEATNTIEESVTKTVAMLDNATRENTSGKFFNVIDGTELPW